MTTGKFDYVNLKAAVRANPTPFQGKITLPLTENSFTPTGLIDSTSALYNTGTASDGTHIFILVWQDTGTVEAPIIKSTIQPDGSLGAFTKVSDHPYPNKIGYMDWMNMAMKCYGGYLYVGYEDTGSSVTRLYSSQIGVGGSLGAWQLALEDANLTGHGWNHGFYNDRFYITYASGATYSAAVSSGTIGTLQTDSTLSSGGTSYAWFHPYGSNMLKCCGMGSQRAYVANLDGVTGRVTSWTPNDTSTYGTAADAFSGNASIVRGFFMHSEYGWGTSLLATNSRPFSTAGNFSGSLWNTTALSENKDFNSQVIYTNSHCYFPAVHLDSEGTGTVFKTYYSTLY